MGVGPVVVLLVVVGSAYGAPHIVTVRNDVSRLDATGSIIDAHSGLIVERNGTYYLYGERYGNCTGMVSAWAAQGAPKVGVYTSTDMETWHDRGLIFPSSDTTQWVPYVFFDEKRERFVAWYGSGDWGVATSQDGIHFSLPKGIPQHQTSRLGGQTDGNWVFIDDDGQGYIIFSATTEGHLVSIERLTEDYLQSSKVNVSGFFPDGFVECPMLFKRNKIYYVTYGSCCCACREGSGLVVFSSSSIHGPWVRQTGHADINCPDATSPICRSGFTIPGQGYTLSRITTAWNDEPTLIWMSNRWIQAPHNNPECVNLCQNPKGQDACVQRQPLYRVGHDPTYWTPLDFDSEGKILPLRWRDSFQLQLP